MVKVSWVAGEVPVYCSLGIAVQDTTQGREDVAELVLGSDHAGFPWGERVQSSRVGWKWTGFELVVRGSKSNYEGTRVTVDAGSSLKVFPSLCYRIGIPPNRG